VRLCQNIPSQQTGSILLVVLVFLLVLGQMVMSSVERAQLAQRLEFNFSDRGLAFHAAESALFFVEQQFLDVLADQGILSAAARWPVVEDQAFLCRASNNPGGSDFTERFVGDSLQGFSSLSYVPLYRIQSVWPPFDLDAWTENSTPELESQVSCSVLYLAHSCGFGRSNQTIVHLQLTVYACCDSPAGCAHGNFYGHHRSLLTL